MSKREWQPTPTMTCEGCGYAFQMGDSIYILHLGLVHRDYCHTCKEKIIDFLDKLAIPVSQEQVPATEATNHQNNHEAQAHA